MNARTNNIWVSLIAVAIGFIQIGCDQIEPEPSLQSGDVIFASSSASGLAGAINDVTKEEDTHDYVHMALAEITDDDTFLIHADTDRGVSIEDLASFKDRYPNSEVYRIQQIDASDIDDALSIAKSHIGKPYNFNYYNNDSALYCSQLIHLAYHDDSIFKMNPMTFRNPESDSINPFWRQYYDSLGVAIPEGVLGCNPNHMSENARLNLIGKL